MQLSLKQLLMERRLSARILATAAARLWVCSLAPVASAGTLRIVDWNIEDDINEAPPPRSPGFNTVLEGIGKAKIGRDPAQPIDIMTLEENTSIVTSVQPILNMLNGDYAGANYQMSPFPATEVGGDTADGNGPNAVVFIANTVNSSLPPSAWALPGGSSNGEPPPGRPLRIPTCRIHRDKRPASSMFMTPI